ncbi:MAG: preprotein translocase subunit SecY [Patescibacteria group bacterium]|nr:preprotein translocase subunit SecY [Patescibacteria group bacterium]MDD5490210.1 preprotein translocase subunit SecY [Patescibacteria group bacterium]
MWYTKLTQIWKIKDLRQSILYVLGMLAIFRLAAHIPIPGVNVENLKDFFGSNQILGLMNIFSGGGMENFSIVAMGVAPYITASIIFQLLTMIIPKLEEISKEESGRQKINHYTRILAVPLAILQSYGMITILKRSSYQIISDLSLFQLFTTIITLTAGTIFLMWIGELISEKHVGNGISILIFAGIITALPTAVQRTLIVFDPSQLFNLIIFALLAVVTIVGVVIINEGQRNVPVSYARRVRGMRMYGGMNTHLPLRVNMAGVIPIIFAISIILVPPMISQFFLQAKTAWLVSAAHFIVELFQNQLFYGIAYFILVFGFTYFYTAVIFHPDQISENLQKQGGFIPGIRPGKPTAEYLQYTLNRILLAGALFLALIAILPLAVKQITGLQTLVIGGTSLLIVVSVVIETMKQIESQLTMREYEGF